MSRRYLAFLAWLLLSAVLLGCTFGGLFGQQSATPTPTKTFVPTFTATPDVLPTPTDTPEPPSPEPTPPPALPEFTETPTPTVAPPTNTPTTGPPPPTSTPKPPPPTATPQPVYTFRLVQEPNKDRCDPGWCLPEISGIVLDAEGNPLNNFTRVWLKLDSVGFGVQHCMTGDEAQMLQPGQFKFSSDGLEYGEFTLTVVEAPGGRELSAPYWGKMNAVRKAGQQTGIVFQKI